MTQKQASPTRSQGFTGMGQFQAGLERILRLGETLVCARIVIVLKWYKMVHPEECWVSNE